MKLLFVATRQILSSATTVVDAFIAYNLPEELEELRYTVQDNVYLPAFPMDECLDYKQIVPADGQKEPYTACLSFRYYGNETKAGETMREFIESSIKNKY